jgi:hypothetical protein
MRSSEREKKVESEELLIKNEEDPNDLLEPGLSQQQ